MHWNSLQEFFDMGGYAFYVWSSMAVTFAALALELAGLRVRRGQLARRPILSHPSQSQSS